MRRGELGGVSLVDVLHSLGSERATGGLRIEDGSGDEASVHIDDGCVYAVGVPGRRPRLGARLVSSGALSADELARVLAAQRAELASWQLAELLVRTGRIAPGVVATFATEELYDAASALAGWPTGRWRFQVGERGRDRFAPRITVPDLVEEVRRRHQRAAAIRRLVPGPFAVPRLGTSRPDADERVLDASAWSLLCRVDGERSVADLARECGFTVFEAAERVYRLVEAGVLTSGAPTGALAPPPVVTTWPAFPGPNGADPCRDAVERVARALATLLTAPVAAPASEDDDGQVERAAAEREAWTEYAARRAAEVAAAEQEAWIEYARRGDAVRTEVRAGMADRGQPADAGRSDHDSVAVDEASLDVDADVDVEPDAAGTDDAGTDDAGALTALAAIPHLPVPRLADDQGVAGDAEDALFLAADGSVPTDNDAERASAVALLAAIMNDAPLASADPREPTARPPVDGGWPAAQRSAALSQRSPARSAHDRPVTEEEFDDTASLLRELSSLGAPAPAPAATGAPSGRPASARPPAPAADKAKRRKGLFGRG